MANRFQKSRRNGHGRMFSAGARGAAFSAKIAEKSIEGLFRWATTDHTGFARAVSSMPSMGLVDTLRLALVHLIYALAYAIGMGIAVYLTVALWIPFLIGILFF